MTVRALIVDDSPSMRALIAMLLRREPGIEVVGSAGSAEAARGMIRELNPDVVTLDVEMPGMDGLTFLEKIMRLRPMPVVMVSSLTRKGAEATIRALEIGAVDCYAKPKGGMHALGERDEGELARMVIAAATAKPSARLREATTPARRDGFDWNGKVVAIGASTGGVEALSTLLDAWPANGPPTLIVQHMPKGFTASFAARLDSRIAPRVVEAEDGIVIEPGTVYIAPSGDRHLSCRRGTKLYTRLVAAPPVSGHRPAVDMLLTSTADTAGADAVGIVLTGMGSDGAEGLLAMRQAGALTLGQDRDTALIYGMPRAAFELGAVVEQLPLDRIAQRALDRCCR